MARTCPSVCALVLIACFLNYTRAQVGSLCRSNERFLSCGSCQKTCRNPAPACAAVCNEGCYCEEGQVRDDDGICIFLKDCPSEMLSSYAKDTSEPLSNEVECPENEEYRFCEPCNRSCDQPHVVCPAQCARGCFCKGNLLRDSNGLCVEPEMCSNLKTSKPKLIKPIPYKHHSKKRCGPNMVYKDCEKCEKKCIGQEEKCEDKCTSGCFCAEGFFRSPTEQCVAAEDCAAVTLLSHELGVEDCSAEEVFLSCGWCEPSCREPNPECTGPCTRGCLCKPPLLRHRSGQCVEQKDCALGRCSELESFTCVYGCETRCDGRCDPVRPRRCKLGCHCKPGLYRNINGTCVSIHLCDNPRSVMLSRGYRHDEKKELLINFTVSEIKNGSVDVKQNATQELCLNEETYTCLHGCEARCDSRCKERKTCSCYCKPGLFRDTNGKCVQPHLCDVTSNKLILKNYKRGNSTLKKKIFNLPKSGILFKKRQNFGSVNF